MTASIQYKIRPLTNVCYGILIEFAKAFKCNVIVGRTSFFQLGKPEMFAMDFLYSLHIRGHFELLKAFLHFYSQFPWFLHKLRRKNPVIKNWNVDMMAYFTSLNFNPNSEHITPRRGWSGGPECYLFSIVRDWIGNRPKMAKHDALVRILTSIKLPLLTLSELQNAKDIWAQLGAKEVRNLKLWCEGKGQTISEKDRIFSSEKRNGSPEKCFDLPKSVCLKGLEKEIWEGFEESFLRKEKEKVSFREELRDFLLENLEILATETNEMFEDLDVIFEIPIPNSKGKEVREFHGIRALFAIHSDVFRAMLFGKMKESQKNARVRLDDITPEAFQYIQRLFYGMRPRIKDYCKAEGFLESLLYTSKKYLLKELQVLCEKNMGS